ncbi:MAG TPA: hypothetical protein DDE71_00945 [Tenacibaculum sp.]|nr:hypothetical protein [Tenacibaculum sp.]
MKKSLEQIKSWFETGDVPTQQQFYDTWDSFYHKDNGYIINSKTINDRGDIHLKFSDGEEIIVKNFSPEKTKPISYIEGLKELLNNIEQKLLAIDKGKVNVVSGKVLSSNDFSNELKDKLEKLQKSNTYNLSHVPAYLNFSYFGKNVFGILLQIPEKVTSEYFFTHDLNIDKYLRLEVWENGIPKHSPKMKIREDLTQLVYSSLSGIVGDGVVGTAPVGVVETGELLLHENSLIIKGDYVFPENKLVYIEYTRKEVKEQIPSYSISLLTAKTNFVGKKEGVMDFVVFIGETEKNDSNGVDRVEFLLPIKDYYKVNYNFDLQNLNGHNVSNSDWEYSKDAVYHRFSYIGDNGVFKGGAFSKIGVSSLFMSPENNQKGELPLEVKLAPNSGGQVISVKDKDSDVLVYGNKISK